MRLRMSRLGLASSYGAGAREVERAFDRGIRFFFWGALRTASFGAGLRRIARKGDAVIAIQSFTNRAPILRASSFAPSSPLSNREILIRPTRPGPTISSQYVQRPRSYPRKTLILTLGQTR